MSNFSFPPPPPPPPKAAPDTQYNNSFGGREDPYAVRGGRNDRGRGDRGRGQGYGRGRGQGPTRGGSRGGFQYNNQQHVTMDHPHWNAETAARAGQGQYSSVPNTSQAPYHSHAPYINPEQQAQQPNQPNHYQTGYSRGEKRKFAGGHEHRNPPRPQYQPKPKSEFVRVPKTDVAPAVPPFGGPLIPENIKPVVPGPKVVPDSSETKKSSKRRRISNQLGLTPHGDEAYDSDVTDGPAAEEVHFAKTGGPIQIEYNGIISVLGTREEYAAWIAERKKRFPTRERIEQHKAELEKRRAEAAKRREEQAAIRKEEQESKRKEEQAAARKKVEESIQKKGKKSADGEEKVKEALDEGAKLEMKLAKIQKKLEKTKANAAKLAAASTESTLTPSTTQPAQVEQMYEDNTNPKSMPKSDSISESDAESGSEAPEVTSSKPTGPVRVAPPKREGKKKRACRFFLMKGWCSKGDSCEYKHELPERGAPKKPTAPAQPTEPERKATKTLFQRLVEQQEEEENKKALAAIKFLGERGVFDDEKGKEDFVGAGVEEDGGDLEMEEEVGDEEINEEAIEGEKTEEPSGQTQVEPGKVNAEEKAEEAVER